jgi:hypothetical protein
MPRGVSVVARADVLAGRLRFEEVRHHGILQFRGKRGGDKREREERDVREAIHTMATL